MGPLDLDRPVLALDQEDPWAAWWLELIGSPPETPREETRPDGY